MRKLHILWSRTTSPETWLQMVSSFIIRGKGRRGRLNSWDPLRVRSVAEETQSKCVMTSCRLQYSPPQTSHINFVYAGFRRRAAFEFPSIKHLNGPSVLSHVWHVPCCVSHHFFAVLCRHPLKSRGVFPIPCLCAKYLNAQVCEARSGWETKENTVQYLHAKNSPIIATMDTSHTQCTAYVWCCWSAEMGPAYLLKLASVS